MKPKYGLYGIAALAIIGIVFISGCTSQDTAIDRGAADKAQVSKALTSRRIPECSFGRDFWHK